MNSCETIPETSDDKLSQKIWKELLEVRSKVLPDNDASFYTFEPCDNEQLEISDQIKPTHKDIETSSFVFTENQQKFVSLLTKNRSSRVCPLKFEHINQKLNERVTLLKRELKEIIDILRKDSPTLNPPPEESELQKIKNKHQLLCNGLSCCFQQSAIFYQLMKPNTKKLGVYLLKPNSFTSDNTVPLHIVGQVNELQGNTRVQVQYTNNFSIQDHYASVLSHQYQIVLNRCSKLHQVSLGTAILTQPISVMLDQFFPITNQLKLHTITSTVSHLISIDLNLQVDNGLTKSFFKEGYLNSKMYDVSNENFKEIAYLVDALNPEKRLQSLLDYSVKPLCEQDISTVVKDAHILLQNNEKNCQKAFQLVQKLTSFENRLTHVKYSLEMTRSLLQEMRQCRLNQSTIIHNFSST